MDDDTEFGRDTGLNHAFGEGVVANDVALHEVVDVEVGAGIDGHFDRIQVVCECFLIIRVNEGEGSAEVIYFRFGQGSFLGGDEQDLGHALHSAA